MSVTRSLSHVWLTAMMLGSLAGVLAEPAAAQFPATMVADAAPAAAHGPLARLVHNPDSAGGLPPYALADQAGTIQRYVEPVPGISLEPYVGTVVIVRHDTGRTLLASQLELPGPSLPPQLGATVDWSNAPRAASGVYPAQHVEIVPPDGQFVPDGVVPIGPGGNPPWSAPPGPPGVEPIYLDSMSAGIEPCPYCGGLHGAPGGGPEIGCGECAANCATCPQPDPWRLYADVDINVMRVWVMETAFGKLSEHYDVSPRIIVGTENPWLDGRIRYWRYHETTPILVGGAGSVRFEFDVLDIEATSRLQGRRTDVVLAGGLRLADLDINAPLIGATVTNGYVGLTLAADAQTRIFSGQLGQWGVVYGGRLSLLAGDRNAGLPLRDDNVLVHEFYGGVEYMYCFRRFDVHARVTAEMQNWNSDALWFFPGSTVGFFGPSCQFGINF